MDINQKADRESGVGHSTSEISDREGGLSRRTYLKGAVATGLAVSLAGCLNINETFESSVVGLDPDWAGTSAYVSADHRAAESTYESSTQIGSLRIAAVSHAVTYEEAQTPSEVSSTLGVLTTPIPTIIGQKVADYNPVAVASIQELVDGENAKSLLEGLGVDVGRNVNWETGPAHEVLDAEGMTLMGSPVEDYVLTNGVLRTGDALRAVLLLVARVERDDPHEVLLIGSSVEQVIEEGVGSESLRDEYADSMKEAFGSPAGNIQVIDPQTDLAMFS
jgi:hypothetical protein